MKKELSLKMISDPGHGWLEVPVEVYRRVGVKASQFSYYSPKRRSVYLEEDCDAPKFLSAAESFYNLQIVSTFMDPCFVRNCERNFEGAL